MPADVTQPEARLSAAETVPETRGNGAPQEAAAGAGPSLPAVHAATAQPRTDRYRPLELLRRTDPRLLLAIAVVSAVTLWAYYPSFRRLVQIWWSDPQYSHGFLVPVFTAVLCWLRRERVDWSRVRPSWWAVPVLIGAAVLRLFGTYFYMEWFEHLSLLPLCFGLLLAFGGWQLVRGWWPAVLFLIFMIPFPYRFEIMLSHPLQRIATKASCYLLQTLGEPAVAEGNTILVNEARLEVVQACNGLRMAISFVALAVAMVMVIRRPLWERFLILASALPIALISNILRITVTGLLYNHVGGELAHVFFHDVAGWLMMPLALGMLWAELALVNWVLVEEERTGPIKVAGRSDPAIKSVAVSPRPRMEGAGAKATTAAATSDGAAQRKPKPVGKKKRRKRKR